MAATNNPRVNAIVSFLNENDKTKLESLKGKFKDFSDLLEPGILLAPEDETLEESEYKFRLEVCHEGLVSIAQKVEEQLPILTTKLKRLNSIQLISQIIVILSGAAILSTIQEDWGENYNWIKFIAPTLILISSLLTLYAKNRSESFLFGDKNLYELTNDLLAHKNQAQFILSEIKISQKFFNIENAKPLIENANNIAKEMNETLVKIS